MLPWRLRRPSGQPGSATPAGRPRRRPSDGKERLSALWPHRSGRRNRRASTQDARARAERRKSGRRIRQANSPGRASARGTTDSPWQVRSRENRGAHPRRNNRFHAARDTRIRRTTSRPDGSVWPQSAPPDTGLPPSRAATESSAIFRKSRKARSKNAAANSRSIRLPAARWLMKDDREIAVRTRSQVRRSRNRTAAASARTGRCKSTAGQHSVPAPIRGSFPVERRNFKLLGLRWGARRTLRKPEDLIAAQAPFGKAEFHGGLQDAETVDGAVAQVDG